MAGSSASEEALAKRSVKIASVVALYWCGRTHGSGSNGDAAKSGCVLCVCVFLCMILCVYVCVFVCGRD